MTGQPLTAHGVPRDDEAPGAGPVDQVVVPGEGDDGLRSQVSHGVRWGVIASVVTQAGRLLFMMALMRLLGPHNFGIVGQAAVYIQLTQIFLHLGLATYIIQRPDIERADIGSAVWLNAVIGSGLALLTFVAAPALASFFRTDELVWVLRILSASFVLKALAVVPTALLNREMRFRTIGAAEISAMLVSGTVGVVAALNGASYWALVIQTLTFDALFVAIVLATTGRPELTWSGAAARRLWAFGSQVMGADLVNYVSDNGDKFLIARFLGATPLALYTLAYRILVMPVQFLTQAGRVILPTFSRLQGDLERLSRAFLRSTESVAILIVPLMTLTILCAPIGVPLVFGEAWAPAVVPMQLLSAMTAIHMLALLTGPVVLAVGRADWEFRWSLVTTVVALSAFAVGLHWGITGVAASYLCIAIVLNPVRFLIIQRLIPLTARGYLRALAPSVVCSAVLCAAWLPVAAALHGTVGGLGTLVGATVVGLAAFVASVRVLWPNDFRKQMDFARSVARRGVA